MVADRSKILIVDDKQANLFSLEQVLKETGAEIIQASNGNEALVVSLNHDLALAILDVQMPEMDGYELAEWLRSEQKTKELPIIFVSAVYSSDHHVFKGYDAGAVDFMVKPFNAKVLLSKVNVFLHLYQQKVSLKRVRNRLARANDTLEEQVKERTQELQTAVTDLKIEIKKRVEAENEIRKAKKQWQEIFEAIGQMTMIMDKDHTIIAANRITLKHTGLTLEEIIGRKCCTVFHHSDLPVKGCPVAKLKGSDYQGVTESEIEMSGRTYIVSCTPVFDANNNLEKIIHIATDVTKHKQLRKELVQAHKMEAIGSLAGGIAHDFNNILAAVLGFTDLALKNADKGSELEEDLKEVYSAGIRARDLIKQILNFARETDEELTPVRIDVIAKEVLKFIRSTIPASIDIRQNIDSQSLVLANPVKIHQIFMNLCTNAAHAMSKGGVLDVALTDMMLEKADLPAQSTIKSGDYQKLTVSDTGVGIPADIMDSIFLPFFTTKGIHEGTGMGLAMVHNVVKECGGEVSVESQVGKGTVFTILLPTTQDLQTTEKATDNGKMRTGMERILIVDDEASICNMASRMLERYGYKVVTQTDSEAALALFSEQPAGFDLVITDMAMPRMSGDTLTKKMLLMRPDIPVIIATGYSQLMSGSKAVELGAKEMLTKPYEKKNLLRAVQKALDKSRESSTS